MRDDSALGSATSSSPPSAAPLAPPPRRSASTKRGVTSRDLTSSFFPTLHQTSKSRQFPPTATPTPTTSSSSSLLPGFSSSANSCSSTSLEWDDDPVANLHHHQPSSSRSTSTTGLTNSTSLPQLATYSYKNGHLTSSLGRQRSLYSSRGRSASPSPATNALQHHLSPQLPSSPTTLAPSRSPRQLHPHDMADFDDEPVVPRSSKQAKMLGVGVDLDPAGSKGLGARTGRNNGFGDPSGDSGLENWNGWGAKVGNSAVGEGSSSPRLDNGSVRVIAPWGQSASTNEQNRKGKATASQSNLRGSRSANPLVRDNAPPPKEKRKGTFGLGFLKRKTSRSDVRDGYHSDSPSLAEQPAPHFDNVALPAKLQARGDTADILPRASLSASRNGKSKYKTKPPTPNRGNSIAPGRGGSSGPTPRNPNAFTVDPEISLDTNLNSMEGIVNFNAINAPPSASLSRSPSSGSTLDPADPNSSHHHNNGFPEHWVPGQRRMSGPMLLAGSRRGSLDPNGYLPSSSPGSDSSSPVGIPGSSAGGFGRKPSIGNISAASGSTSGGHANAVWASQAGIGSTNHAPISPLSITPPGTAARPGLLRTSSGLSAMHSYNMGTASASAGGPVGRRPSAVNFEPVPPGSAGGSIGSAGRMGSIANTTGGTGGTGHPSSGAWTAPDSWAVKAEAGALDHDSSEEEVEDEETEDLESEGGMSPDPGGVGAFGSGEEGVLGGGRPGTRDGRPGTKSGRPGTADGLRSGNMKPFMIRIFRPDSTFSTLPAPLTVTAAELTATLARKFQVNGKSSHALYLREKGTERRVGANEKPVLLQKRRFEQAGYTELDKLEELGREDNSYLCKLIYKATHSTISAGEEDVGDSREFVDLSGKNVETIPIFLYRHAHEIVSLNLSKNRPFDLPTDFVQLCTSLRELVLSHMGIKRIPQAVKECVTLTRLDISNNHIVELEHISLEDVGELMSLKCHNNRLWNLPDYFARFKMLKYLNLSNNRFDSIPAVVAEVTSLVELDISFNTINVVPPEIGQLKSLERLVLLANTINSLPPTLSNLEHLKELDCRRNLITDLSPIANVPSLEVLRCEHNQASVLDATWAHIRILTASNNSLTRFVISGTSMSLTSLNLSFAKLSTLAPDMFSHLGSVENLVFDSNQIRIIPDGIGSLGNLVNLSFKNNLLAEIPSSIGKLGRLNTLNLSGNNLQTLPASLWNCPQLTSLNASSNLLKDFPDPPEPALVAEPGLDEIEARKLSTISKAPSTSSGRVAPPLALSLQKLFLGDNQLENDSLVPISLMSELRLLNLSFNEITEVMATSFFRLGQLEELYLSGNKLTSLPPDDLERLTSLRLLYLNGNRMQTLPAELGKIKKLYALDVGSNVLKYNIANWPYDWNWNWNLELRYLNLSGNKRLEIKPGHQNDTSNLPRSAKRRNLADFSALTKLRILGLMDVTLMIPSVPDENEDRRVRTSLSEINEMGYGIADTLGQRHDTLSLVDIVVPRFRSKDDEAIFGLFDAVNKGQNTGAKLVKYLQDSFTAVFTLELSRLKSGEVTSDALRRAFLGINRDYGNLLLPSMESRRKDSEVSLTDRSSASVRTGAAGIIVYIRRKRMYVANAGNALAVIASKQGKLRFIGKRHEPFDAAEIARIRTAEGWISHRGYVNDEVDISRSFGFYNVFPAINASPDIDEIELEETDEFVIIANRGLWEHMSYQAAVDVARTERADPMAAAAKLRDLAISYGSSQNVMVMVLAVGDLYNKTKKGGYRSHRAGGAHPHDDEGGLYGAQRTGMAMRSRKEEGAGERYLNLVEREIAPPVGMVALVFTDIRNSTALWESNPGMQTAIRMHNQLLRRQLRAIGGYEVKTEGDAFMVSFPTVTSALLWCLTVQLELLREDWPQEILDSEEGREITNARGDIIYRGLSVRMGMHWGAPVCEADPITRRMDYFGPMVNRSARISAVAEGGQISASQDVIDIIQEVVMDARPEPSSLDSDSGEEEEEDWLDPSEKQDVLALRRLGFGMEELGERRLKGLETAEVISLIWPKALKDRIKPTKDVQEKAQTEIYDPSSQIIDVNLVKGIGRVCQRLEAAAAAIVNPLRWEEDIAPTESAELALARRKAVIHPTSLAYPIRPDSSDEELAALLEGYLQRIENVLSTLTLHRLGPYTEVLAALGAAVKTDPRSILNALSRFAAAMH